MPLFSTLTVNRTEPVDRSRVISIGVHLYKLNIHLALR